MSLRVPGKRAQTWLALCLTCGEFGAGIWLVLHDGHMLALYLACTYTSRETAGGRHWRTELIRQIRKLFPTRKVRPNA
jgi:hypothetical protein